MARNDRVKELIGLCDGVTVITRTRQARTVTHRKTERQWPHYGALFCAFRQHFTECSEENHWRQLRDHAVLGHGLHEALSKRLAPILP